MTNLPEEPIPRLLAIIAELRHPTAGCPWDRDQSFATIAPYTIEEAYEVADAAARQDLAALKGELGDLLFQVVYHARLAEEIGAFTFNDVVAAIADKMLRRHPHVFGADATAGRPALAAAWEAQKRAERLARGDSGVLAGIPATLPALSRAEKLCARAARVGFDWPDAPAVLEKLEEEIAELRAELGSADPDRLEDEIGDILFVIANLARKLHLDPEAALRRGSDKFAARFTAVERLLAAAGQTPAEAGLPAMEAAWQQVKRATP